MKLQTAKFIWSERYVQTRYALSGPVINSSKHWLNMCAKNKPNGQFHLPFECEAIKSFMAELPIRKLPGVGRVHERLLDSIGVHVSKNMSFLQRVSSYGAQIRHAQIFTPTERPFLSWTNTLAETSYSVLT